MNANKRFTQTRLAITFQGVMTAVSLALSTLIGYPIFEYLFVGSGRFMDFTWSIVEAPQQHSPELLDIAGYSQVYSPTHAFIFKVIGLFILDFDAAEIFLLLFLPVYFYVLLRLSNSYYIAIVFTLSGPVLFALGRGNIDYFAGALLGVFVLSINKGKFLFSSVLLGFLVAMKAPYIVFILAFLLLQKYKHALLCIVYSALFFITPLFFSKWGVLEQIYVFRKILSRYSQDYVLGDGGFMHNTSLFGIEKTLLYFWRQDIIGDNAILAKSFVAQYFWIHNTFVALLLVAILVYFTPLLKTAFGGKPTLAMFKKASKEKELEVVWLSVLFVIVIQIAIVPVSAEYRWAQAVPVTAFLIDKGSRLFNTSLVVLFSTIYIPKHFLHIQFAFNQTGTTIASVVNPILSLAAIYLIAKCLRSETVMLNQLTRVLQDSREFLKFFSGRSSKLNA